MKVKELLSDESKWCKRAALTDADGNNAGLGWDDPRVCRRCLWAAVRTCYREDDDEPFKRLAQVIGPRPNQQPDMPRGVVIDFNDDPTTTFADIRRVLEEADV